MSTHTPGPWIVANGLQVWGNGPSTVQSPRICTVQNASPPVRQLPERERIANARLIAACPDMLAALRAASLALMGCAGINDENEAERAEAIATARAAIAKATGDTTKGGANGEG